jgi:putative membrane protein
MPSIIKFVLRTALAFLVVGIAHTAYAVDALPDARFVGFVQEANDFEIGAAQLALQKSSNERIRGFANRMLVDHQEAVGVLAKARQESGVTFAPTPGGREPRHAAVLDRLAALNGTEFDAIYASSQLDAHIEAVDQFGAYSQNGGNANLRRFAQGMLPKLKEHLEHARRIAGQ